MGIGGVACFASQGMLFFIIVLCFCTLFLYMCRHLAVFDTIVVTILNNLDYD